MATEERQKIIIDLDELFPGDVLTIGKSKIMIRPLNTGRIVVFGKKLQKVFVQLKGKGITLENYNEPENLIPLTEAILDDAPDLLAEAANVDLDNMLELPLPTNVEILKKVIEVNMKAKDDLLGNFASLMGMFSQEKTTPTQEKKSKSPKSSKN